MLRMVPLPCKGRGGLDNGEYRPTSGSRRVHRAPVPRDLDAPAEPDVLVAERMLQETLQPGHLARPAREPAMKPDRHHLRPLLSFGIEHIEGIAQVGKELVAG